VSGARRDFIRNEGGQVVAWTPGRRKPTCFTYASQASWGRQSGKHRVIRILIVQRCNLVIVHVPMGWLVFISRGKKPEETLIQIAVIRAGGL